MRFSGTGDVSPVHPFGVIGECPHTAARENNHGSVSPFAFDFRHHLLAGITNRKAFVLHSGTDLVCGDGAKKKFSVAR